MRDIEIIDEFERKIADYAGSKYGIAVSSGTNAIFLSLQYLKYLKEIKNGDMIIIPSRTYMSVPMSLINSNLMVKFEPIDWSGIYQLKPTRIWDATVRLRKDMYIPNSLQCLSFQYRKHLPIGRGGMILTDSKHAYDWLRQARHNGKHPGVSKWDDEFEICGWDMYMLPEQCAKGLTLFNILKDDNPDCGNQSDYPDLSKQEIFK